ncbi:hypothetical protein D3C73_1609320 [compost metagenome]
MGAADRIAAQLLQDANLLGHQLGRKGKAPFGMLLMPVDSLKTDLLAVQKNPSL